MIFQETLEWFLHVSPNTGEPKTFTTRWQYDTDQLIRDSKTGIARVLQTDKNGNLRVRYEEGKKFAAQPARGSKGLGFGELAYISSGIPGELAESVFHREGFASPEDYLATLKKMHGNIIMTRPFWILQIKLLEVKP